VTLRIALGIAALTMGGCELVVDDGAPSLASTQAGADGGRDSSGEAGAVVVETGRPDSATAPDSASKDDSGPACGAPCLSQAASCQQTCAATLMSCMSTCHGHGSGPCEDQCSQDDAGCRGGCSSECIACFAKESCAGSSTCST
jgi:hypothetical protein